MFNKLLSLFKTKKQRFKDTTKKEKEVMYLGWYIGRKIKKKRNNTLQLKINFNATKGYIYIFVSIFFTLFILGVVFLFFWNYFNVKYIKISDDKNISSIDLLYDSISSFRDKNIFMMDTIEMKSKILDYQKNVSDINISKIYPNKIEIDITSYPIIFETLIGEKKYFITSNWVFIPKTSNIKVEKKIENIIVNLKKKDEFNFFSYQKKLKWSYLKKVNKFIELFKVNLPNLPIDKIYYYNIEREIHFELKNGTFILFDLESDILPQIKKIIIFNENNNNFKHVYIDMRIKSKIFFCSYEHEYQCRINMNLSYKEKK